MGYLFPFWSCFHHFGFILLLGEGNASVARLTDRNDEKAIDLDGPGHTPVCFVQARSR
jgi:hypothetical protein